MKLEVKPRVGQEVKLQTGQLYGETLASIRRIRECIVALQHSMVIAIWIDVGH